MSEDVIRVLGMEDGGDRADRLSFKPPGEWRLGRTEIPVEVFQERVTDFVESMRQVIAALPEATGKYQLDQVTVSAEVSAKGKLSLLGSGGELSGKAGLTFTFTRRNGSGDASRGSER